MQKLVIITTVPMSLATLLKGQPKYLSSYFNVTLITSSDFDNKEIEKYEEVELVPIDMSREITPLKDLISLWKLYRYFRKNRPDIVYTFTPKAGLLGMMASFFSRVPIRIHNIVGMPLMETDGMKKSLLRLIEKLTYAFSTKLFCNSYGLKEYISRNLTTKDIKVLGNGSINGVDGSLFKESFSLEQKNELRKTLNIRKNDFVLTFVGRVVQDKGVNELISAFILLEKQYNYLKLLIVGDFEEHLNPIDRRSVEVINNNKNIISIGFKKNIRPYLEITNLFVLPSYREGLPNSLIEAGSFGIPLLATDINGCNEIIENKTNGILVKVKSVDSLVSGVQFLLDNPDKYKKIKSSIRSSILRRYNQQDFWKTLRSELEKK